MTRLPRDPEAFVAESAEGLDLRKKLVSASGDTIVAEWEGPKEKGLEYWRFDAEGHVYEHRVYGHEAAEPPESPLERLRTALVHPAAAFGALRKGRSRRR